MESKQYYLRDIRDAINGKEPSMAGINGNSDVKYLKDIADAIRNGGGMSDDNDKVKQLPTDGEDKEYRVLLSNSDNDTNETSFSHKDGTITYNPKKKRLRFYRSDNDYTEIDAHEIIQKWGAYQSYVENSAINVSMKSDYKQRYAGMQTVGTRPMISVSEADVDEGTGTLTNIKGIIMHPNDIETSGDGQTWDGEHTSLKEALAGGGSGSIEKMNFYEYVSDSSHFTDGKTYLIDPAFTSADDIMTENEPAQSWSFGENMVEVADWFNFTLHNYANQTLCIEDSPYQKDKCFTTFQGPRYDWCEILNQYRGGGSLTDGKLDPGQPYSIKIPTEWTYNDKTYYLKDYSYFYYLVGYYNFDFEGVLYITNNPLIKANSQAGHFHEAPLPDGFVFRYENGASIVPASVYRPVYQSGIWNINQQGYDVHLVAANGQYYTYKNELISGSEFPQLTTLDQPLNYMLHDYLNDKLKTIPGHNVAGTNALRYKTTLFKNGAPISNDISYVDWLPNVNDGMKSKYIYHPAGKKDNVIFYDETGTAMTIGSPFIISKNIINNCGHVIAHIVAIDGSENKTEYDIDMYGYEGTVNGDYGSVAFSRHAGDNNNEFSMTFTSDYTINLISVVIKDDIKVDGWLEETRLVNGIQTKVFGLHPVEIDSGSYAMLSNDDKQSASQLYFIPDES